MRENREASLPGAGLAFACVLLCGVEVYLHTSSFLIRYRSVFAVGRAQAKLQYVETHPPALLIVGDSRVDNGLIPSILQNALPSVGQVFNMGMPGSDARSAYGVLSKLAATGLLGPNRIGKVLIGLDEDLVRLGNPFGYEVFFADRQAMLEEGQYHDLMESLVRLWGFSPNLKELREPAKLESFWRATWAQVEPVGGAVRDNSGYRPGIGTMREDFKFPQNAIGVRDPERHTFNAFLRCLDLLKKNHVETVAVFPPQLNHKSLYKNPSEPGAAPYLEIVRNLAARGIPIIDLDLDEEKRPAEFMDPGHLNNEGAKRFSGILAAQLGRIWPGKAAGIAQ